MKEFFGIDVTQSDKNEVFNCHPFLTQQVPQAQAAALEAAAKDLEARSKKAELPVVFRILYLVLLFGVVSVVSGLVRGIGNVGVHKAYENAPWIFYLAGGLIVALIMLSLWKHNRSRKAVSGDDFRDATRRHAAAVAACYSALGVPQNAPTVDVMGCKYRVKNGKTKLVTNGYCQYINPEMRLFTADGCLCLADCHDLYAVPLSEIRALRKINKSVSLMSWNKEDHFDYGRYAQYKITAGSYGNITVKPYYALEISHEGQEYVLHFPSYELPLFGPATKLPVTE